ncbi:MAG: RHS repeat protein [Armatimonadetes bacterium]|nr:RHS repeat protein [Armatimonadota bacterium]
MIHFSDDNAGRLTGVTNARGKTRTYIYTVRHEVYSLALPDGSLETWAYDNNGNVDS